MFDTLEMTGYQIPNCFLTFARKSEVGCRELISRFPVGPLPQPVPEHFKQSPKILRNCKEGSKRCPNLCLAVNFRENWAFPESMTNLWGNSF